MLTLPDYGLTIKIIEMCGTVLRLVTCVLVLTCKLLNDHHDCSPQITSLKEMFCVFLLRDVVQRVRVMRKPWARLRRTPASAGRSLSWPLPVSHKSSSICPCWRAPSCGPSRRCTRAARSAVGRATEKRCCCVTAATGGTTCTASSLLSRCVGQPIKHH